MHEVNAELFLDLEGLNNVAQGRQVFIRNWGLSRIIEEHVVAVVGVISAGRNGARAWCISLTPW